jgi:hypothetical protein
VSKKPKYLWLFPNRRAFYLWSENSENLSLPREKGGVSHIPTINSCFINAVRKAIGRQDKEKSG